MSRPESRNRIQGDREQDCYQKGSQKLAHSTILFVGSGQVHCVNIPDYNFMSTARSGLCRSFASIVARVSHQEFLVSVRRELLFI